jgi:ABC-type transport system substrate-binding protein
MRKLWLIVLAVIVVGGMLFSSCGGASKTTAPATTTAAKTTAPATSAPATTTAPKTTAPATTTPAAGQPVYGGTLKAIRQAFPVVLGLPPEFGGSDGLISQLVIDRLVTWDEKGNMAPQLAETWKGDPVAKTLTFNLRKGVKFSDGTDFNAEAARWNVQLTMDAGKIPKAKSAEVVDPYTLKITLTDYDRIVWETYGMLAMISPTAFQNSGTTNDTRKAWARTHPVGTGPFVLTDFQRDNVLKYAKNPNYWRPGRPYLNGIELRNIPDPMTATAIMAAGDADMWLEPTLVQSMVDLEKKKFIVNWGPGMTEVLLPYSLDANSVVADPKVRAAVEYALNRPVIADMMGFGKFEPLTQLSAKGFPGYVAGYDPRPFSVANAKKMLTDAGYPNGVTIPIYACERDKDIATAVQGYLIAAGFKVDLQITDYGTYVSSVYGGKGWKGYAVAMSGINPSASDLLIHYGSSPTTFRYGIKKSDAYLKACDDAMHTYDESVVASKLQAITKQCGEDATVIPLWRTAQSAVLQPYVHSDYIKIHNIIWFSWDDWMEKH